MTSYQRSPEYVGLRPTRKAGDLLVLNDDDVIDLLKAAVKREGLNSILNGKRRLTAPLAKALGLRRVYVVEEEATERRTARGEDQREDFPRPLVVEANTTT